MDVTLVTAMAGVLGSLVGGSATAATAWIMVVASLLLAAGYVFLLRRQVTANA